MKKIIIASAVLALALAGCASFNTKAPTKSQVLTKTETASSKDDSKDSIQQVKEEAQTELQNYLDEQDLLSKKEADIIKARFLDIITGVDISSFAKGIEADIKGKRAITKKELNQIGAFAANTIRKNRQISGQVTIYYEFNGKTLKGKY